MARFLYPLSSISLSGSIFMTVSITVERYWAVCRPTVCRHVFSNMTAVQNLLSGYYNYYNLSQSNYYKSYKR